MRLCLTSSFAAMTACLAATAAHADITVGVITAQTGPTSSIGIPYAKGIAAGQALIGTIGNEKIKVIVLDDGSDPANASKDARKLIEEDKVDIIIGSASTPSCVAIIAAATEAKVPVIAPSPIPPTVPKADDKPWAVSMPQKPTDMMGIVVEEMKAQGIKNIGFIGFSDGWGDLVYNNTKSAADANGMAVTTNERYARADTSVNGQALKVFASKPDAVMGGGSGTGGALVYTGMRERGFAGGLYGTPAIINPDFVRLVGAAGEGIVASTGPVMVVEQLPDGAPTKAVGLKYKEVYKATNGAASADGFAPYAYDAYLLMADAAKRALATNAKPGTPEFRSALRDAIYSTKDLVGTHGVYNFTPASPFGTDRRGLVLVKLTSGQWKFYK